MDRAITLLTDFGLEDPYAAIMKGVICSMAPKARIVDITHYVPTYNILGAAYILKSAYPYFPPDSIHVAVIDPWVGSSRDAIVIETSRGIFVGPDNGLFTYPATNDKVLGIFSLENPDYRSGQVSDTFHGRDIFAPAAAHLFQGIKPSAMGPRKSDIVKLEQAFPNQTESRIDGSVIHIDNFGNLITNITESHILDNTPVGICTQVAGCAIIGLHKAFYQAEKGELTAYIGSAGHLEIGVNQGNAAEKLNAGIRAQVIVVNRHS